MSAESKPLQVEKKPLSWFKPDPNQPRKHFIEEVLLQLLASLAVRQWQPLLARKDGTIIEGERRWRAAMLGETRENLAKIEFLDVIIIDGLDDSQIEFAQLQIDFHRVDLTDSERVEKVVAIADRNPELKGIDLAKQLNVTASTISRMLMYRKAIPAVQEAFRAGLLGLSDMSTIARANDQEQHVLLAAKLNGAIQTRDQLQAKVRKTRTVSTGPKVKAIACPLPGGAVVTVRGEEIGLDDAIESLSEALKAMKKARDEGLDARTAQSVFRDKAKA